MKINLSVKAVVLFIVLLFFSCSSTKKGKCDGDICLTTVLKNENDELLIQLDFSSKIDTSFYFDEQMFVVGCPFYEEDKVFFKKIRPTLEELKHSQIILENESADFRVFSSQFIDNEKETMIIMPNCAFMEKKELKLMKGQVKKEEFNVSSMNDLKVKKTDSKIRLHLYYKDSVGKGIILTSDNWLSLRW